MTKQIIILYGKSLFHEQSAIFFFFSKALLVLWKLLAKYTWSLKHMDQFHSVLYCPHIQTIVLGLLYAGGESWESLGLQGDQTSQS